VRSLEGGVIVELLAGLTHDFLEGQLRKREEEAESDSCDQLELDLVIRERSTSKGIVEVGTALGLALECLRTRMYQYPEWMMRNKPRIATYFIFCVRFLWKIYDFVLNNFCENLDF
jgi:intein/homing endonuclease